MHIPFLDNVKIWLRRWARERAHGAHARLWLVTLSFSEASFSPIPPDVMLFAILLAGAERWWYYAGITTVSSVLGGIFGYLIGALFFNLFGEAIVAAYHLEEELKVVAEYFSNNAFLAMFISAFTPIPYKIFTIAAGLFHIDPLVFLAASVTGRGLRFFALGYTVKMFGGRMARFIYSYFNILTMVLAVVLLLFVFTKFF
jgi:membrane protein YqaA with SNARE-associated domain